MLFQKDYLLSMLTGKPSPQGLPPNQTYCCCKNFWLCEQEFPAGNNNRGCVHYQSRLLWLYPHFSQICYRRYYVSLGVICLATRERYMGFFPDKSRCMVTLLVTVMLWANTTWMITAKNSLQLQVYRFDHNTTLISTWLCCRQICLWPMYWYISLKIIVRFRYSRKYSSNQCIPNEICSVWNISNRCRHVVSITTLQRCGRQSSTLRTSAYCWTMSKLWLDWTRRQASTTIALPTSYGAASARGSLTRHMLSSSRVSLTRSASRYVTHPTS